MNLNSHADIYETYFVPTFSASRVFFTSDAYNSQVLELFADTY
ncbi:hypothetical protein [Bdellovibrio reynosensis]|nr:hypothetical protein [Bdellovibrio reynosensis]